MSGLRLREFDLDRDYDAVVALWEAAPGVHVGASDTREALSLKLTRDPDLFLVAESGQRLVGAVMGGFDGRRGIVYHLAVAKPYRLKGIGKALMEALEARLRSKGCLKAYLLMTKDNDAAHFYAASGWQPMDLLIYGKDLL